MTEEKQERQRQPLSAGRSASHGESACRAPLRMPAKFTGGPPAHYGRRNPAGAPEEKKLQRQTTQWQDYAATKEALFCCCLHATADARWSSVRLSERQALDCYLHTKADPQRQKPRRGEGVWGGRPSTGGPRRNMTRCIVRRRVVRFGAAGAFSSDPEET